MRRNGYTLIGGNGLDELTGDGGNDTFKINAAAKGNTFLNFAEIIYKDNIPNLSDRTILTSKISIIPDGATLATGVTDSITKLVGLVSNVGIGILQLLFIISVG